MPVEEICRKLGVSEAALLPSWRGSDQASPFRFDCGRLIIAAGNQKLIWERAVKHA